MVSDVQILTEMLEADHRNTLLQGMLTEELMSARGFDRPGADAVVAAIVEGTAAGPVWYQATEVYRTMTRRQRWRFHGRVAAAVGVCRGSWSGVRIVVGTAPPALVVDDLGGGFEGPTISVEVAAEWLLNQDLYQTK